MTDSATNTNSEPLTTSKELSPVIYKHTKGTLTLSPKSLTFVASNNEEEDLEADWTWRSLKNTKTQSRKKLHQITLVVKDPSHAKDKQPVLLFPTATAMQEAQTDLQHYCTRANQAVAKRQTKQQVFEMEKKARENKTQVYSQSVAGPPPQHVNIDDAPQYDEHMAQSTCLRCFHCCCRMFVAGRSS